MRERHSSAGCGICGKMPDLTQTQVAAVLHMSQTGYSKYETGENDIPTQVLIQLAGSMGPVPTTCWGSPTAGTLCKGETCLLM